MVKFSVKKPLTVFVAVLAVLVLGVVAYLKMTPDLLPNMDFPYVVIVTTDPGASPEAVEQEFSGQGYGAFKPAVGEAVVEALRPIREETQRLLADKAYLESLYRQGAEKAAAMANRTLRKVHKKVGFVPR